MKNLCFYLLFFSCAAYTQTGIGTHIPDKSSALEIQAADKGLLIPRISLTGTNDKTTISSPANSLIIYNISSNTDVTSGYYYWSKTKEKWIKITDATSPGWKLTGNINTVADIHYIGTNDNVDLVFKRNKIQVGRISEKNFSWGQSALQNNTTGEYNIALGALALYGNTAGYLNIGIGRAALYNNSKGHSNIGIGLATLEYNTAANKNIAIGSGAGPSFNITDPTDSHNIFIGHNSGRGIVTGTKNTIIGNNTSSSNKALSNTVIIGENATLNISNAIRLGNTTITSITGQVSFSASSDRRFKDHIKTIPLGLHFINKLHPVEYIRKNNTSKTKEWGIIAQELQQTLREIDYKDTSIVQEDGSGNKMLSVRYNDLIAPIIKAIQELSEKNKELKTRIELLEKQNN